MPRSTPSSSKSGRTMLDKVEAIVSPVYQVGGSVRDELLGKEPKDYDFSTPLSPDDIEAAVRAAGKHPYLIGKRFGTVGMKIDGQLVEVTTFRTETYQEGSRKPQVEFVDDITHDLSRRDFTINAIAKRGDRYIDPFGGRLDFLERVIKAVGKPQDRYKEDPLRMLRAARFASQLGFTIESNTEGQAMRMCHRILMVSRERWMIELDKLLLTDKPSIGLKFLARTRLLNFMLPELALQVGYDQNSPYHALPLWDHTLAVVDATPADLDLRWTALLHDIGKPFVRTEKPDRSNYIKHDLLGAELVTRLALYLKWSNDRRDAVTDLVLNHMRPDSPLRPYDMEAH
jgi:putative nucleotidyltransferase with HDIG domain